MATTRRIKALTALAAFVAFTCSQVYVQAGSPTPGGGAPQRLISGRLTTRGGQPITVNGASASGGATILTGATIETPDQVSAVIDLGAAGVVELQPNSKIQLDFDQDGNVRVKVLKGCVTTKKKANSIGTGEIYTDSASEKSDKNRRSLAGCFLPNGQLGSAPSAGATGAGLSAGAKAGIAAAAIGGGITAAVLIARGGNSSPH